MTSPIKRSYHRLFSAILLLFTVAALSGCSILKKLDMAPFIHNSMDADPTRETLREIDSFRGSGPEKHSLEGTFSDNPNYLTVDDQISTAGIQVQGAAISRIRLEDVLLTALKNNRSIRVEDYNRTIAESGIEAAKGIYDLVLEASLHANGQKSQMASHGVFSDDPLTGRNRGRSLAASLRQLVPSGGVLELASDYSNTKNYADSAFAIDPSDSMGMGVSFIQPLLKGFGVAITNAPIRIAGLQKEVAQENFRLSLITQLTGAVQTYWDLVYAIDYYEVERLSLKRAQELLRNTKSKAEAGTLAPYVVTQAEADVVSREARVISASRVIADTADALKRVMNVSENSAEWNTNLIPVDRPTFTPLELNEEAIYQEALEYRPDYRAAKLGVRISEINEMVSKNAKKPQLNAQASYRVTGLDDSVGNMVGEFSSADQTGWDAALIFSHPLQNRTAKAQYRQAQDTTKQRAQTVASYEEIIRQEVRANIRSIDTNQKLIQAWKASIQAEEEKLKAQILRYELGTGTVFEVLDFQEDLAAAQARYLEAIVNYNKSLIELQRVKASFLRDHRVEFVGNTPAKPE